MVDTSFLVSYSMDWIEGKRINYVFQIPTGIHTLYRETIMRNKKTKQYSRLVSNINLQKKQLLADILFGKLLSESVMRLKKSRIHIYTMSPSCLASNERVQGTNLFSMIIILDLIIRLINNL